MKRILFYLVMGAFILGCDPKHEEPTVSKIDPNAMILLRPAEGVQLRSTISGLTALEIVQQAHAIKWKSKWAYESFETEEPLSITRGFPDPYKDFNIPALKMRGIDVINEQGEYQRVFTHGFSVFIINLEGDTLAYVPDSVISNARPLIEAAYLNGDYEEVYRLFNEAYTFLPIPE